MGRQNDRARNRANPGSSAIVRRKYPVKDLALVMSNVGAAIEFSTAVLGDIPAGRLLFFGAAAHLVFSTTSANMINGWTGNFSVGSAPTANNSLADAGDADFVASTAMTATGGTKVTPDTFGAHAVANAGQIIDNSAGSLELNLNVLVADASISGASTVLANGFVELFYALV